AALREVQLGAGRGVDSALVREPAFGAWVKRPVPEGTGRFVVSYPPGLGAGSVEGTGSGAGAGCAGAAGPAGPGAPAGPCGPGTGTGITVGEGWVAGGCTLITSGCRDSAFTFAGRHQAK